MNKKLSIITNFGCAKNCWYCIWKKHKLKNVKGPHDFKIIYNFLKECGKKYNTNIVKISGGGDCLYNYNSKKTTYKWWQELFKICKELDFKIDVHTRENCVIDNNFWKNINKVVISSDEVFDQLEYIKLLKEGYNKDIRVYKVITEETTEEQIRNYIDMYINILDIELTFRELYCFDDGGNFIKYKEKFNNIKKLLFLKQDDYNIYLMPNGKIYKKFMIDKV